MKPIGADSQSPNLPAGFGHRSYLPAGAVLGLGLGLSISRGHGIFLLVVLGMTLGWLLSLVARQQNDPPAQT